MASAHVNIFLNCFYYFHSHSNYPGQNAPEPPSWGTYLVENTVTVHKGHVPLVKTVIQKELFKNAVFVLSLIG